MRLIIEVMTDGDDEGPGSRGDAIGLARDAIAAFKRGRGSHERQFCSGAYRVTVNPPEMAIGDRSDTVSESCKRCEGRGVEPHGIQVNDGTEPCPTCLSAASSSTLRAVAPLRQRLAAAERVAEYAEHLTGCLLSDGAHPDDRCTCGLVEAKRAFDALKGEGGGK